METRSGKSPQRRPTQGICPAASSNKSRPPGRDRARDRSQLEKWLICCDASVAPVRSVAPAQSRIVATPFGDRDRDRDRAGP